MSLSTSASHTQFSTYEAHAAILRPPQHRLIAQMISKHLKHNDLTRQLEECERTLSDQLKQPTWDFQVNVTPPPAYRIILVKLKMPDNTTVREAVQVLDILAESMFKGITAYCA